MLLPVLTAAWWAARAAVVKGALARFGNGSSLKAVAVAITVVAIVTGGVLSWHAARAGIAESRDAMWRAKLLIERLVAARQQAARDRAAEAAADAERAKISLEREAMRERVADLERQLAELEAQSGDPVIFPRHLVRSLRK